MLMGQPCTKFKQSPKLIKIMFRNNKINKITVKIIFHPLPRMIVKNTEDK